MKRYEGLIILNTAGKEEGIKETIDKVSDEIVRAGGKVETVQKMDKRPFSRVTNKAVSAGFYVNFIFELREDAVNQLRNRFALNNDVYRALITVAPAIKEAQAQPA